MLGKDHANFGSSESSREISVDYYKLGTENAELSMDYIVSIGYQYEGMRAVADYING